MEYLITKDEFIKTYFDDMKLINIMEDLGPTVDLVDDYDKLVSIIKDSYSEALDEFVCQDDGLIYEVDFRTLDDNLKYKINEKIGG